MNPAGILIAVAGVWVTCQVFGGNALERLGILKPDPAGGGGIVPPIGPGLAPYIPGGPKNPVAPSLPDIWGGIGGGIAGGKYL